MTQYQRISFLCILVFSIVGMIFVRKVLFQSVQNKPAEPTKTTAEPTKATLFIFEAVKTDRRLLFGEKIVLFNRGLAGSQTNKSWQQEIEKFLIQVSPHFKNKSICANYWAVVVDVSKSVLETAKRLPSWCIVIVVGDREYTDTIAENMFLLNSTVQYKLAKISAFYKHSLLLPKYHYMVQKNLGYLWAIFHEATMIWDFDNDRELIVNESIFHLPLNGTVESLTVPNHNDTLFNPYPFFGRRSKHLWPRGYPPRFITDSQRGSTSVQTLHGVWPTKNLGVINSLIEDHVDMDAVYQRVTSESAVYLNNVSNVSNISNTDVKLIVPRRTFSPYDKRATLHLQPALWALLLPVTTHQHASDIFRSYTMQRLMWDVDLRIAFVGSYVTKTTPSHYPEQLGQVSQFKADNLTEFLTKWSTNETNFIERAERLSITLYEHGYIEMYDVRLVRSWLEELYQIGYIFPEILP